MPDDVLITAEDAAARLGVGRRQISKYIASGRLPVANWQGRRKMIRLADLEHFAKNERRPKGWPKRGNG